MTREKSCFIIVLHSAGFKSPSTDWEMFFMPSGQFLAADFHRIWRYYNFCPPQFKQKQWESERDYFKILIFPFSFFSRNSSSAAHCAVVEGNILSTVISVKSQRTRKKSAIQFSAQFFAFSKSDNSDWSLRFKIVPSDLEWRDQLWRTLCDNIDILRFVRWTRVRIHAREAKLKPINLPLVLQAARVRFQ